MWLLSLADAEALVAGKSGTATVSALLSASLDVAEAGEGIEDVGVVVLLVGTVAVAEAVLAGAFETSTLAISGAHPEVQAGVAVASSEESSKTASTSAIAVVVALVHGSACGIAGFTRTRGVSRSGFDIPLGTIRRLLENLDHVNGFFSRSFVTRGPRRFRGVGVDGKKESAENSSAEHL